MKRSKPITAATHAVQNKLAAWRLGEALRELGVSRISREAFLNILRENNLTDRDIDDFLRQHDPAANRENEMKKAFSK